MNGMNVSIIGFLKAVLVGMVLVGAVGLAAQQEAADKSTPQAQQSETGKVNINTADLDQLTSLPRIGPVIAQRIITFRQEHEGFKKLEELMNVSGIGRKTFDRLAPLITL